MLLGPVVGPRRSCFAQQDAGEAQGLRIERAEDGLYLGASFDFTLPDLAEDALHKGIPMFFVMEAQVRRDRWYWSDRVVAEATRYLRLSYQPLTRRWRLSTSSVPFTNSGLGVVLGQNFDELDEALSAMRRVIRWRIGDADVLEPTPRTRCSCASGWTCPNCRGLCRLVRGSLGLEPAGVPQPAAAFARSLNPAFF